MKSMTTKQRQEARQHLAWMTIAIEKIQPLLTTTEYDTGRLWLQKLLLEVGMPDHRYTDQEEWPDEYEAKLGGLL